MRNYVIINGVNSLTIQGLAIKTLPPITKPIQRNLREEIDGRDGDIVTTLGYGAYDKTIEIGLFGTFDIDEVIAYFNQKGTITFSNEADKVYYFEALDQVDYAELLKFRTANVVLHCQPFKYPLNETPLVEEYEYVNGSGTNFTLNNTAEAIFNKIDLIGNTEQTQYTGKNLAPITEFTLIKGTQRTIQINFPTPIPAGTYTFSWKIKNQSDFTTSQGMGMGLFDSTTTPATSLGTVMAIRSNSPTTGSKTMTITQNATHVYAYIDSQLGDTATITIEDFQVETGSSATDYEPYVGGIPSPNPNYPQDIHVVSGDNEINVCGKNLLNRATCSENKILTWAGGVEYNETNSLVSDYMNISKNVELASNYNFYVFCYDKNKNYLGVLNKQSGELIKSSPANAFKDYTLPNIDEICYARIVYRASANSSTNMVEANIILNRGTTTLDYEPYNGDTYELDLGVENLFDKDNMNVLNASVSSGVITSNVNAKMFYIPCKPNTTYTMSREIVGARFIAYTTATTPAIGVSTLQYADGNTASSMTITTNANANYLIVYYLYNASENEEKILSSIQVELGSKANSYSPYGQTPIELCKIGDYQDYIYKDNGSWYLHKEIGKYIFDSTWSYYSVNNTFQIPSAIVNTMVRPRYTTDLPMVYCNYLSPVTWASSWATLQSFIAVDTTQAQARIRMSLPNMSLQDFQTWLTTHEMYMLYQLATPTNTEITDTTLISQLEELKNATSYEGQTNISQTNNDLPFILDLSALKENSDHLVIDNIGNIYSKPTLDLEGTGIVDIYLNDTQMFEVDLSEKNEIVIDTEKMEAYNPTDNTLANRQVTGDYSKFKLDSGENDLRFSGDLTKATITRYERWL